MVVTPWPRPTLLFCRRRSEDSAAQRPTQLEGTVAVLMNLTFFRKLIRLVHPDRHQGGEDEKLANEVTAWLLEQRSRLR
jgi:hypothetical protein